jgi:hypothetical protein
VTREWPEQLEYFAGGAAVSQSRHSLLCRPANMLQIFADTLDHAKLIRPNTLAVFEDCRVQDQLGCDNLLVTVRSTTAAPTNVSSTARPLSFTQHIQVIAEHATLGDQAFRPR